MSCYSFFLDGVEVEEPQGFDGMAFKKERHAVYFGFLHPGIGYGESENVTFVDDIAVGILRGAWRRSGVEALVEIIIRLDEQVVFSGNVDFAAAKIGPKSATVSFKMPKNVRDFLTSAPNTITVTPGERLQLPDRPNSALASHEIAPDFPTYSYRGTEPKDLSHFPVWETTKSGSNLENLGVADGATGISWHTVPGAVRPATWDLNPHRNEYQVAYNVNGSTIDGVTSAYQDVTVKVIGLLHFTARSAAGGSFSIVLEWKKGGSSYVTDAGDKTSQLTIAERGLTATATEHFIFFEETLTLQAVGLLLFERGLSFKIVSFDDSADFSFDYQPDSFLSIEKFVPANNSPVDPLFFEAESLIKELVKRNTGMDAVVNLGLLPGEKAFISSGKNVRGLASDFGVSFETLYKSLDGLLCLSAEMEAGKLVIRPKADLLVAGVPFPLSEVSEWAEEPTEPWTFSRVKLGFKEWQAESPFGLDEINSSREYSTGITAVEKELDIRSELIGSGYVLQEGRSRIGTDLSREDWSFDEQLFIVIGIWDTEIGAYRAKTDEDEITLNLLNSNRAVNLTIRPTMTAQRWLPVLSVSGPLTFSSGEGNYRAQIGNQPESRSFQPVKPLFSRRAVRVETPIGMDGFAAIGSHFEFETDEGTLTAVIHSITWRPAINDGSAAEILGFLI